MLNDKLSYKLSKHALRFLKKIPAKHAKQIIERIGQFTADQKSVVSEQLQGYPSLHRIKSGEYRIIYRIEQDKLLVFVLRVGKRNDDEVYKNLDVLLGLSNNDV